LQRTGGLEQRCYTACGKGLFWAKRGKKHTSGAKARVDSVESDTKDKSLAYRPNKFIRSL
jgi:hypothetical protein